MNDNSSHDITQMLIELTDGNTEVVNQILPRIYDELRKLASSYLRRERADHTLQPTALVHEAYLKVAGHRHKPYAGRAHFCAVAAKAMRHILCNYARDRSRKKRGGGVPHLRLDPGHDPRRQLELADDQPAERLAALDEALHALEDIAERQARVVECRFFGGMNLEDTATALGCSPRTVMRDWTFARAWLRREMQLRLETLG